MRLAALVKAVTNKRTFALQGNYEGENRDDYYDVDVTGGQIQPDDITTTKSVLTMTKLPITTMTTVMMKKVKG